VTFEESFRLADPIPGWLTRDQARRLHEAAQAVPLNGTVVEIGSHQGRSTVVLATGLRAGARLVAIDPFPEDWRYGAAGTEATCRANLAGAGVDDRVDLRVSTSRTARDAWSGPVDLVYIDGKHDLWTLRDDLRWAERVRPGGSVFVHDAFSSVGVTLGLLSTLPWSRTLTYVGRTGSLAHLELAAPSPRDRLRPMKELPWWVRNLAVKVCLRVRLAPLARLLGHDGPDDPF
jgi:hypothetical protein